MTSERTVFGTLPDGRSAHLFVFRNDNGTTLKFTDYGLIVTELHTRDAAGVLGNVVLGFDNLPRYLQGHPFFGVVAGRFANRIALGKFSLDGKDYTLAVNNGPNHLHGGTVGFDKRLWTAGPVRLDGEGISVDLTYTSPDGEEGYPGALTVVVTYTLTRDDVWRIDYRATTDAPTILNLTNHSFFNLAGKGDVLQHELELAADQVTEVDSGLIPTGRFLEVKGTALDFTQPTAIGSRGMATGLTPPGYDHNFVLRHGGGTMGLAATVLERTTGRRMECHTDQPGVQLWTMNRAPVEPLVCTGGFEVPRHGGFCLETQHFPDSIHHPHFPTCVLRPGEVFSSRTEYRFGTL
jgi:aldose 1-epimerase